MAWRKNKKNEEATVDAGEKLVAAIISLNAATDRAIEATNKAAKVMESLNKAVARAQAAGRPGGRTW